ncbi:MAG: cell division protein FtsA [Dehalococcoidia bacterium]|nr:cell division protein FtsA [Dehalococcoidia bacterium]
MPKGRLVTAIDVGTTKICTLIADVYTQKGIQVLGVGIVPSEGLHKGVVADIPRARASIKESVRKAEQMAGKRVDSAYVGVTGRHVDSLNNKGIVAINRQDRKVRTEDLRRALEVARAVSIPSDRKVLHIIPRGYMLDNQTKVENPVGMHGFRLDVETHLITAAIDSVQNLAKCVRGLGIDIEDLVLEPLASAEAVLEPDEREAGVILADIGGGTTDIAVFKDGSIYHTSVIPVAGYQVTRDIALGLNLPFEMAEAMKKKYGSLQAGGDGTIDTRGLGETDGHAVSYQDLNQIIRARVDELLRLIVLELPDSGANRMVPAGLVLTGGSSNLPGMDIAAQELLRMPVRIGTPSGVYGITDAINDPAHATGVGLLLWATHKPVGEQSWHNLQQSTSLNRFMSTLRKIFLGSN